MMIDKVTIEHFPNRYSRPAPIHPMSIERNGWSGGLALPQLGWVVGRWSPPLL